MTEVDNERVFREQIVPTLLAGRPRQARPVVLIVAGPTWAGQSAVHTVVRDQLQRRGGYVDITADGYASHHPGYPRLLAADRRSVHARLRPETRRWSDKAQTYAIGHGNDVVLELAMRSGAEFEQAARRFRDAGYRVEAALVVVPEALSGLGDLYRRLQTVDSGRPEDHDGGHATHEGVLRAAEATDRGDVVDQVVVYRPDGHELHRNEVDQDGTWPAPAAAAAVRAEQARLAATVQPRRPHDAIEAHDYEGLRVVELPPNTPAAKVGTPLVIPPGDILRRRMFNLGFEEAQLKTLQQRVLARLADTLLMRYDARTTTVQRLAAMGTRSRDAIHQLISYPMFTRELEFMLSAEGLDSPDLVADGGPLTDTHGIANVRVELANPRVLNYINGWHEWSNYGFTEHHQSLGGGQGQGQDVKLSAGLGLGFAITGGLSLTQTAAQSAIAVMKSEWPTTGYLRKVPWLRIAGDAVVHLTLNAHNRRGRLAYGGGNVTMSFLLRDALELAFGPEALLEHGLLHPHGMPTPAGVYLPSHAVATDRTNTPEAAQRRAEELHAAFSFPPVDDAVVVHVATRFVPVTPTNDDDGLRFEVNDRILTADELHDQVLRHLDLAGKTLILVGSHIATPGPHDLPSGADRLAGLTTGPVIAAAATAHTTSDGHVLAATPTTTTHGQHHITDHGRWIHITIGHRQPLTADLIDSIRRAGLTLQPMPKSVLPPKHPVLWGQPATSPTTPDTTTPTPPPPTPPPPTPPPPTPPPPTSSQGLTARPIHDGTILIHPTATPPTQTELDHAAALPTEHNTTTIITNSPIDPTHLLSAMERLGPGCPVPAVTAFV